MSGCRRFSRTSSCFPRKSSSRRSPLAVYARRYGSFYPRFDRATYDKLLADFQLPTDRKLTELSYGQKKKLLLAFGIATNARLLILDEPTNGLDIPGKQLVRRALINHFAPDRSVLISTHQVHDLEGLIDSVMIVADGTILLHATLDTLTTRLQVQLEDEAPDDALYVEERLEGYRVVRENSAGMAGDLDLELLFGLATSGRRPVATGARAMSPFDASRFRRQFLNDLLQQWRKIWIATLAAVGLGLVAYLTNLNPPDAPQPELYAVLFPIVLLVGGLIFTSTTFADLHHPLQQFQFLTLPCSNLERFLSRYLLSAPLYYLYVLVVYAVFDWVAALAACALLGRSAAAFAPFEPQMVHFTLCYFGLHALMFGGAIYFRSHALIKTGLSVVLIGFGLVLVQFAATGIFFWSYFRSLFPFEATAPVRLVTVPSPVVVVGAVLLYLWVLFLAYLRLREHEVQRAP